MPLKFLGYSVRIRSGGEELLQYQVEKTDERTITCWIPSQAGKTFSAHISTLNNHGHDHKTVRVFADGRRLAGLGSADKDGASIEYREISGGMRQSFVFSEVAFAPDEDPGSATIPEDVGVVDVQVWAAKEERHKKPFRRIEETTAVDQGIKLTEKSKLIGANCVRPGTNEAYVPPTSYRSFAAIGDKPYALFRFKHRPASVLQAMGIMPRLVRPPSPPAFASTSPSRPIRRSRSDSESTERDTNKRRRPNEEDLDIKPVIDAGLEERRRKIQEEIDTEETKAKARQAALRAQLEELGGSSLTRGGAHVKAERAPSPISVPRSGEVIDLTDD
ncbi:hypothetical protein PENSPDRAFT_309595 [Peniophora sp. CONT]|nr:hypothetical protein PENSPDRAFT_309595 [Peniophora sp. CONT]